MYLDSNQQWAVALSTHRKPLYQLQPTRRSCRYPVLLECCSPFTIQQALSRHRIRAGCHRLQPTFPYNPVFQSTVHPLKVGTRKYSPATNTCRLILPSVRLSASTNVKNLFHWNFPHSTTSPTIPPLTVIAYWVLTTVGYTCLPAGVLLLTPICLRETIRCK